ncbi:phospholipase effector Tle1 domain-containing protein [Iodobacter sp.]|uniref:phospholipase effector Tle1 domain-containing protein n=1 Tax=Iodobacter sp. TaxID=1915058 RepID=UPI0025EE259A|nr:DUF2235 domain-containing protein [Iodobacter sp.]
MNDATAKSDRIKAEARDLCPVCEQTLWISFYFDAFAHHKDDDGDAISNIGKLWRASLIQADKGIFSNYYSGLGARFEPEMTVLAKMQVVQMAKAVSRAEEKIATDAYDAVKEKITAEAAMRKEGWWKRIERTVAKDLKKLKHDYKNQWDIVWRDPKDRARYLRGVGRYWKTFANDLIHHPLQIHKHVSNELAKTVRNQTAERVGFVRDAVWVAALFNTGVDTRLEQAEEDFKENVRYGQSLGKIKHINVSIFGADFGGALALAFADRLANEVCKQGKYKGIQVHFRFMGLLDCVCSRFDDNFLTGYIPLANAISGSLKIPRVVEKVVHYAAAHEYRLYKPLSTIGGARKPGGRLEERLFPGAQADVIGGYQDKEQGVHNELARLPLQWMLNNAWRNGVPVMSLPKMKVEESEIYALFYLQDSTKELVDKYWLKARELAAEVKTAPLNISTQDLQKGYVNTAHSCMQLPMVGQTESVLPADVKAELPGHIVMHTAWLKSWYESYAPGKGSALEQERYAMLKNEINTMTRRSQYSPLEPGALSDEEKKLWAMWQNNSANNLGETKPLFQKFIHDSMAESAIERAWDDLMYSRHYLNHRLITPLEQQPKEDFFDVNYGKLGQEAADKVAADKTSAINIPKPRNAGGIPSAVR